MRPAYMTFAIIAAVLGSTAAATNATADQNRGTMEQQMACTSDVFRLCGNAIPDTDRIVVCLRLNTPQLSQGCRAVFEANDSVQRSARQGGWQSSRDWH